MKKIFLILSISSLLFAEISDQQFRSSFVDGLAGSLQQQGLQNVEATYIGTCVLFRLEAKYTKSELINSSPSLMKDSQQAMQYCYKKMMRLKSKK